MLLALYALIKQWDNSNFWFEFSGMIIIMFLSGMFYFENAVNKSGVGAILLILTIVVGVYLIGWKVLLAVGFGMYQGGYCIRQQFKDDLKQFNKNG